jgi:hypothetical protein
MMMLIEDDDGFYPFAIFVRDDDQSTALGQGGQ